MVGTKLYIHVSDTILNKGEPLTIWGTLLTETGNPLTNAQICLKDKDALYDDYLKHANDTFVCQVITGLSGAYNIVWNVEKSLDDLDNTIELYAEFKTSGNYEGSVSEVIKITILEPEPEEKQTKLTIFTDKTTVIIGEPLKIWGKLTTIAGVPLRNGRIWFREDDFGVAQILTDENNVAIYDNTDDGGYFSIYWNAVHMDWDKELELYAEFDGSGIYLPSNTKDSIIKITTVDLEEEPLLTAEIETITYEIHEQIGEDEITFTISIKNTSEDTIYNYIKLFDSSGNEIDKEPDELPKRISKGEIENIILSSEYKFWSIKDIQEQTVIFKLYSDFSSFTKLENYEEIDSKSFDVEKYSEDKITPKLTIILNTTTVVTGDEIRISGMLTTKEGIPLQFGRVWIYATGGTIKNFLMDESDVVLYADTDSNGIYQIYWNAKQMDKDETVELVAMTESDDKYNAVQSSPIVLTLTDIEEELEEQEGCFIDNPLYPLKSDNPCIISDTQATWIKYGAIGIAGLYVFSTVTPIIKGTGKIFEKKVSK